MRAAREQVGAEAPGIRCHGLTMGDFSVPPFGVRAGDRLCLHVHHGDTPWYEVCRPLLSGKVPHPALQITGNVQYLDRMIVYRRWWGMLYNPTALDWLTKRIGLAPDEATALLQRLGFRSDLWVRFLGLNERTFLAVEAVLARPPDVLAFDTAGNDLYGIRHIHERLSTGRPDLAIVFVKTNLKDTPCFPGAACLDVGAPHSSVIVAE